MTAPWVDMHRGFLSKKRQNSKHAITPTDHCPHKLFQSEIHYNRGCKVALTIKGAYDVTRAGTHTSVPRPVVDNRLYLTRLYCHAKYA